jgi:hypothetical protein
MKEKAEKEKRLGQEKNLPFTRWQLLGDTLRFRFWDLLLVSLFTLVFYLPVLGWLIFCSLSDLLDFSNLPSILMSYGIAIPFLMIAGLGMGGLFYFSKKLAWGEGASLPGDFFEGIKKNARMFLGVYFVIGLLYLILRLDIASLVYQSGLSGWALGALEGVSYTLFFLFLLALFFLQSQTIIYQGGFFHLFWNGIKFVFGAFLSNIPIFLAFFAGFLCFEFIPYAPVLYIVMGIEGFFYFGFSSFFFTLYSDALFDKSINPSRYPGIIRKGLQQKEKDNSDGKVDL